MLATYDSKAADGQRASAVRIVTRRARSPTDAADAAAELVSSASARSRDRYRRAGLTATALLGARGISAITTLVTVPLTLSHLGAERFGVWATISSLASLLIFADLGIGSGVVTAVATAAGRDDRSALARLVASATWSLAAVAVAFALLVTAAFAMIDWPSVLNIRGPVARAEAGPAVGIFGLLFAAGLPLSVVTHVRYGLQEGYANALFAAVGNVLGLVGVVVAVALGLGLPLLVLAFMGGPLVGNVANAVALFAHQRPSLAPHLRFVSRTTSAALLRSGSQFLVLQIAMALAFYSDTLIATAVIGPQAGAEYAVGTKLFLLPGVVVAAVLTPLWPAYGEAFARGDRAWIGATLRRSLVVAVAVTVPMSVGLLVAADPILAVWIGRDVEPPYLLLAATAVWTVMSALGSSVAAMLNGMHVLRVQVFAAVAMAILNVSLSVVLAQNVGVAGVMLGTVIAYPISTLLPMAVYVPRVLKAIVASPESSPAGDRLH